MELPEFPPAGRPSRGWASSLPCCNVNSVPAQKQAAGLNTHNVTEDGGCQRLAPSPSLLLLPFKPLVWSFFLKKHVLRHSVRWSLCHKTYHSICPFSLEPLLFSKCSVAKLGHNISRGHYFKPCRSRDGKLVLQRMTSKSLPPREKLPTFINWIST